MRIESCGLTNPGLKRSHNEDHFACADDIGLYLVADGMGGHAAGEIASSAAIGEIIDFMRRFRAERDLTWPYDFNPQLNAAENALVTAILMANQAVCNQANENQAYGGMGTTIVGLMIYDSQGAVAHVGDSRLYRLRGSEFSLLTFDHSWVNEQLRQNVITEQEAKSHRWRNVITRALGNRTDLQVDIEAVSLAPGDTYLLCTDGLSGMVCDEEMQRILQDSQNDLDKACRQLIAQANANGGIDNTTAVVVRIDELD